MVILRENLKKPPLGIRYTVVSLRTSYYLRYSSTRQRNSAASAYSQKCLIQPEVFDAKQTAELNKHTNFLHRAPRHGILKAEMLQSRSLAFPPWLILPVWKVKAQLI